MDLKLMTGGQVCPGTNCSDSRDVRRGMHILSSDGREVGQVAALVYGDNSHAASHLLLSRLPEVQGYWLVSVDLIAEIDETKVQLSISDNGVESLPEWHSKVP